jgi:lipoprotein-releasing system permease protein
MKFEIFLAKRYMRGNRHTWGGSLTSVIAIGGVAVGVAALIVTLSVMTGFREDIRRKILGAQPHLMVMGPEGSLPQGDWAHIFSDVPDVVSWSPYIMGQALIRKGPVTMGVVAKGIDPEKETSVTGLQSHVKEGRWEDLSANSEKPAPPILLGRELARSLHAEVGDQVLLAAPSADMNVMMNMPSLYPFTVAGVLETGLYDYDSTLVVMTLPAAQQVFHMEMRYSGLGVKVKDPDESMEAAMRIQKEVGSSAWVRSWLSLNHNLFAALKLEKTVMFVILALITLVAAFNIVSNLLLVTAQKVREIGILRAMGATRGSIQKIFLLKGILMGSLGTGGGVGLGLILASILKKYQFIELPADVYYVENLPVKIMASDVGLVAGAALLVVLLASLYPSRLASKLDALTAIRQ